MSPIHNPRLALNQLPHRLNLHLRERQSHPSHRSLNARRSTRNLHLNYCRLHARPGGKSRHRHIDPAVLIAPVLSLPTPCNVTGRPAKLSVTAFSSATKSAALWPSSATFASGAAGHASTCHHEFRRFTASKSVPATTTGVPTIRSSHGIPKLRCKRIRPRRLLHLRKRIRWQRRRAGSRHHDVRAEASKLLVQLRVQIRI